MRVGVRAQRHLQHATNTPTRQHTDTQSCRHANATLHAAKPAAHSPRARTGTSRSTRHRCCALCTVMHPVHCALRCDLGASTLTHHGPARCCPARCTAAPARRRAARRRRASTRTGRRTRSSGTCRWKGRAAPRSCSPSERSSSLERVSRMISDLLSFDERITARCWGRWGTEMGDGGMGR